MDIPNPQRFRRKQRLRYTFGTFAIALFVGALIFLLTHGDHIARINTEEIWIGTVVRGDFEIDVQGMGKLVPYESRWVSAPEEGQVEELLLNPGAVTDPHTPLLVLKNADLVEAVRAKKFELESAQSTLESYQLEQERELLDHQCELDLLTSQWKLEREEATAHEQLYKKGLLTEFSRKKELMEAENLETRVLNAKQQMEFSSKLFHSHLKEKQTEIEHLNANLAHLKKQIEALHMTAEHSGILQRIDVEKGQQVSKGQALALVVDTTRLKAVIQISESKAHLLSVGLPVQLRVANESLAGTIVRILPTADEGQITLEVSLPEPLPPSIRPEMTAEAKIRIMQIHDTLSIDRPVNAIPDAAGYLYTINTAGTEARIQTVEFGSAATSRIQILSGLEEGQQVILSDMSKWDHAPTLLLK